MTFREWAEQVVKIDNALDTGSDNETLEGVLNNSYWNRLYHNGASPAEAVMDNYDGAIPGAAWDAARRSLGIKPNGYLA